MGEIGFCRECRPSGGQHEVGCSFRPAEFEQMRGIAEGFGADEVTPALPREFADRVIQREFEAAESAAREELKGRIRDRIDEYDPALQVPGIVLEAAVEVFAEFLKESLPTRPSSGPWASWGGDGVGP